MEQIGLPLNTIKINKIMKRLLYILFFIPLLGLGQYSTTPIYNQGQYAFKGDGTNNYADFGSNILNSSVWTVAFRLNNLTNVAVYNYLLSSGSSYTLSVYNSLGVIVYRKGDHSYVGIGTGYNLLDGNQHDVIVRCDGLGNGFVYVDGTYNGTDTDITILTVRYLFQYYTGIYRLSGNAWDVRIWNTDIGATECLKYHSDNMDSIPNVAWLPIVEGNQDTIYDVSGNGNDAIAHGSNYWTTDNNQTYPQTYGVTKVKYDNDIVLVPYLPNKIPLYNHSSPIMNPAEKYINYPATVWNYKHVIK